MILTTLVFGQIFEDWFDTFIFKFPLCIRIILFVLDCILVYFTEAPTPVDKNAR